MAIFRQRKRCTAQAKSKSTAKTRNPCELQGSSGLLERSSLSTWRAWRGWAIGLQIRLLLESGGRRSERAWQWSSICVPASLHTVNEKFS